MQSSKNIVTFTGNPLAETTLRCAPWTPGGVFRAHGSSFQVGGKGINVSRMLVRFGTPTTAITFFGGDSGAQCERWLKERGIPHEVIRTSATRIGTVVRADGVPETTFLGPDCPPDSYSWESAALSISKLAGAAGVLAVCGSVPGDWDSFAVRPFRIALEELFNSGSTVIVDTYGPPLKWLVEYPVSLVKINAEEFGHLLADSFSNPDLDTGAHLCSAASRWPLVKSWIITDGAKPIWHLNPEKGGTPRTYEPPRTIEVSQTGSGDVFLAGLLHAHMLLGMGWEDAIPFALPYAAANAGHPGVAEFEYEGLVR